LLPVRVLSVVFRGKLLSALEAAVNEHRLRGTHDDPRALLRRAAGKPWVVYSKPPFGGPEQVLRYSYYAEPLIMRSWARPIPS
jgi:hypothetical protein